MRRLGALICAATVALLCGCGTTSSGPAHIWLTHPPERTSVCLSQDCGPDSITLNWSNIPLAGRTGYYIFNNGAQIDTATGSPYTFKGMDCATTYRLGVEAHDGSGNVSQLYTIAYTTPGCGGPPSDSSPPTISGALTQGSTLTAQPGSWSGSPTFAYQWQECDASSTCSNISGATGPTYVLGNPDVDHSLVARVTATNSSGSSTVPSPASGTVGASGGGGGGGGISQTSTGSQSTICNLYASPTGTSSGPGTIGSPYQTAQQLIEALSSGQVGCLRAGTYGSPTTTTTFDKAGITLTAYPGEVATLRGYPWVTAANTSITHLNLDLDNTGDTTTHCNIGTPSAYSLRIDAGGAVIEHDQIYQTDVPIQERAVGIGVGWGDNFNGVTIAYNKIHDLGTCLVEDQAVYLDGVSNAQVFDNWIYDAPAGTGVELFASSEPGPTNASVHSNVFDGDSSCFTLGGNDSSTSGDSIQNNICVNSAGFQAPYTSYCGQPPVGGPGIYETHCTGYDPGVPIWTNWSAGVGSGNSYQSNDDYCAAAFTTHCTTSISVTSGLSVASNHTVDPGFADPNYRTSRDYRVTSSSVASGWGMWNGDATGGGGGGGSANLLGPTDVGASTTPGGMDTNSKRASCYAAGATGSIKRLTIYLHPTNGTPGTQNIEGVIYASGPGALLGTSTPFTFSSTDSAGWYDLNFPTPVSVTSGTTYCIGVLSGDTAGIAGFNFDTGTRYVNTNTYPTASNPFGTATTDTSEMSEFALIQ